MARERDEEDTRPNLAELATQVVSALTDLRITLYGVSLQVAQLRQRIEAGTPEPGAVAPQLEAHPEFTPAGGVRITPEEWAALNARIADQEHEKNLQQAKADGAAEALKQLEVKSKRRQDRAERNEKRNLYLLAFVSPVSTLLGGVVTWLMVHLKP